MTSSDPGPIVQRILLGIELTTVRDGLGMSQAEAARDLGWSAGKLSKIEHGDAKLSDRDLERAVAVYRIDADHGERLQELATEARRKLPPSRVREWAAKYVNLERSATRLDMVQFDMFPGAMQTEEYARAVLTRSVTIPRSSVDVMARDRARRADRFRTDERCRVRLIVGEEAIRRPVGGPEVMRAQLTFLLSVAQLPHVTVQALPLSGGAHASAGVAFTVVELLDGRARLVYVEGLTAADYLVREHVSTYSLAFESLTAAAMSPDATRELVESRLE
ncbi:helix-turn-helix transcriptional regulator [Actinokineospora auranticolor]|nr:helix-turn-helix transcriptional regulator [Actinokineospora auranticolor]